MIWLDSCRTVHEWTAIADLDPKDLEPALCKTTGYLVSMTAERVAIALNSDEEGAIVLNMITIPAVAIREIYALTTSHTIPIA